MHRFSVGLIERLDALVQEKSLPWEVMALVKLLLKHRHFGALSRSNLLAYLDKHEVQVPLNSFELMNMAAP